MHPEYVSLLADPFSLKSPNKLQVGTLYHWTPIPKCKYVYCLEIGRW